MALIPSPARWQPIDPVEALGARLAAMLDNDGYADWLGIAHTILEVLMRPDQQDHPDALSRLIETNARMLIARKFGLNESVIYTIPHHDHHVAPHLRGSWKHDVFPNLVSMAYLLGATRTNLPHPHHRLLGYYQFAARKQEAELKKVAAEFGARPQPPRQEQSQGPDPGAERRRKEAEAAERRRKEELRAKYLQELADVDKENPEENIRRDWIKSIKTYYREQGLDIPEE